MTSLELQVQSNDKDELYFEFPEDLLNRLGWDVGDDLQFNDNKDGSFTIKKVNMTSIELDFTEKEYYTYLKAAHEADMSFNEWVASAMTAWIEHFKHEEQKDDEEYTDE